MKKIALSRSRILSLWLIIALTCIVVSSGIILGNIPKIEKIAFLLPSGLQVRSGFTALQSGSMTGWLILSRSGGEGPGRLGSNGYYQAGVYELMKAIDSLRQDKVLKDPSLLSPLELSLLRSWVDRAISDFTRSLQREESTDARSNLEYAKKLRSLLAPKEEEEKEEESEKKEDAKTPDETKEWDTPSTGPSSTDESSTGKEKWTWDTPGEKNGSGGTTPSEKDTPPGEKDIPNTQAFSGATGYTNTGSIRPLWSTSGSGSEDRLLSESDRSELRSTLENLKKLQENRPNLTRVDGRSGNLPGGRGLMEEFFGGDPIFDGLRDSEDQDY